MIEINGGYYIKVDTNPVCYTLMRRRKTRPKDGGEPKLTEQNCGYFGSLRNALLGLIERERADRLVDKDMKLSEAVTILQAADDELISAIKGSCPTYKIMKEG